MLLTFRHQQKQHGIVLEETGDSSANDDRHSEDQNSKEDFKFNYHKAKMRFGLLLADINDAIKEGDGERIRNLYKVAVLLFKCYSHTKYAYSTLLFLTKISAILPLARAESLIANRFCNAHGKLGKNISMDLFLEFKNRSVKACTDLLGSNFREDSAQRIARSTSINEKVLSSVDTDCNNSKADKSRSKTDPRDAVRQVVLDLLAEEGFVFSPGRKGYPSFPEMSPNLINGLDYRDMYNWMREKLDEWEKIYEH